MPTARDEGARSVESVATGAADALDGNDTNEMLSWLVPTRGVVWDEPAVAAMLKRLMSWTVGGHLAWAVFPCNGERI